jgi:hypothetical protein
MPPDYSYYTTHTIRNTIATASDNLGDDEVPILSGAAACMLLACIRHKSVKNDRGSKTRRVWARDLFIRPCVARLLGCRLMYTVTRVGNLQRRYSNVFATI